MSKEVEVDAIKEVRVIESEIDEMALDIISEINSLDDLVRAQGELKKYGLVRKRIKDRKETITKPFNLAMKNLRELFRPAEEQLDVLDRHTKDLISSYDRYLQQEKAEQERLAEEEIAKGKSLKIATAPVAKVNQQMEAVKKRKIKRIVITDESKLPREYLIPDELKIKTALLSGQKVDGAELVIEEIIVR